MPIRRCPPGETALLPMRTPGSALLQLPRPSSCRQSPCPQQELAWSEDLEPNLEDLEPDGVCDQRESRQCDVCRATI